jgi:hypothetical protein
VTGCGRWGGEGGVFELGAGGGRGGGGRWKRRVDGKQNGVWVLGFRV